jgi:Cellulose binding domain/Cellulase (glycosyl hydrolase family 5)
MVLAERRAARTRPGRRGDLGDLEIDMRTNRIRLALLAAVLTLLGGVAVSLAHTASAATDGFVSRCGVHFCLNGKTYYFAGANTYDVFTYGGSYGDTETQYMDKTRIDNHFAELQSDGVSVLRLWMFDHESWHGFESSKGVYNDQEFAEFDYIIQSAKAHNIRLIPTLENYWEAYGGIDTRLSWEGLGTGQSNRWRFFNKTACPGCFTQYKNYVSHALNRVNHYSNVAYKDDPTIFAWDLMNEPRYEGQGTESTSGTTLRAWVDEMGAYIKGIDSNHMVYAGIEGHQSKYGFGGDEGNPFVYLQQSPYIDFTSAHPYPNEGWANLTLDQTITLINAWNSDSVNLVGKPFFLGEFNTMGVDRSTWWTSIYNDIESQDIAGSAFWWYPDPSAGGDNYAVKHGAPELSVFKAHSARMVTKSGGTPASPTSAKPSSAAPSSVRPSSAAPSSARPSSARPSSAPPSNSAVPGGCSVSYVVNDWGSGFTTTVTITSSTAVNGWNLKWSFAGNQQITNAWNAVTTQSGQAVTATNASWNAAIPAGGSTSFGFQASYSGSNAVPASFTLNGVGCARL